MTLTWENGRSWRKSCSNVTLSATDPTHTSLGLRPGLFSDKLRKGLERKECFIFNDAP